MSSSAASYAQAVYMIFEISDSHSIFKISTVDDEASSSSPPRIPYSILSPVVILPEKEYPCNMGFFSVGSKIFMIGGCWYRTPIGSDKVPKSCKDVYIYDTTTSLIEKSQSCMLVGKYFPWLNAPIIHHNDGKIYVLNNNLCCHGFESFDPQLQSWSLLPAPPVPAAVADYIPPVEFDIVAHAIVDDTILVSIRRGDVFFFHSITHIWSHLNVGGSGSNYVPFLDRAAYAADADDDGAWFALVENFLYSFRFDDGSGFMGSPVKNLVPPAPPITEGFLVDVVHLGNQRFCVFHCGFDDQFHRYVTITVFRPEPVAVAVAVGEAPPPPPGGIFSAIDQHSLSYLLNDDNPCFLQGGLFRACFPV